ncbi:unnamed protein product [Lampetra fluviatilis]
MTHLYNKSAVQHLNAKGYSRGGGGGAGGAGEVVETQPVLEAQALGAVRMSATPLPSRARAPTRLLQHHLRATLTMP